MPQAGTEGRTGDNPNLIGLEHRWHYWPVWPVFVGLAITAGFAGGLDRLPDVFNVEGGLWDVAIAAIGPLVAVGLFLVLTGDRSRGRTLALSTFVGTGAAFAIGIAPIGTDEMAAAFWAGGLILGYIGSRFQNRYALRDSGRTILTRASPSGMSTRMGGVEWDPGEYTGPLEEESVLDFAGYLGAARLRFAMPATWGRWRKAVVALLLSIAAWAVAITLCFAVVAAKEHYFIDEIWLIAALLALACGATDVSVEAARKRRAAPHT